MQEQFSAFVDHPGRATAVALQQAVRTDESFTADAPWDDRARSLLAQGRHDEVIRVVTDAFPAAFMSPRAHLLLSLAHAGIGQREESRREAYYASVALDVIAATGDGTADDPWHVLHVADEYAFLAARDVSVLSQRLVAISGGEALDALACGDGRERHFLVPVDPHE